MLYKCCVGCITISVGTYRLSANLHPLPMPMICCSRQTLVRLWARQAGYDRPAIGFQA